VENYKTTDTDACKSCCTVPVHATIFLKMNPQGSKHVEDIIKFKILVYKKCILLVYIV